jgi:WD40 repeat protein
LSYSWKGESSIAPVIQSCLQSFLRPWYKTRALSIFRDLSSLAASSDLYRSLEEKIDQSNHLIVLASRSAAGSEGMEFEAKYWFSKPRSGQILILVIEPDCSTWAQILECLLPPTLTAKLSSPPLWIDISAQCAAIRAKPSAFDKGKLVEALKQVFLALYPGKSWTQLRGEERQHRRRVLAIFWSAVAALSVTTGVAVWQAFTARAQTLIANAARESADKSAQLARDQERQANASRLDAERSARASTARALSVHAMNLADTDAETSLTLGELAIHETRSDAVVLPEAEQALLNALSRIHSSSQLAVVEGPATTVRFSPDGKTVAIAAGSTIHLVSLTGPRRALKFDGAGDSFVGVDFLPDGQTIVASDQSEGLVFYDLRTSRSVSAPLELELTTSMLFGAPVAAMIEDRQLVAVTALAQPLLPGATPPYQHLFVVDASTRKPVCHASEPIGQSFRGVIAASQDYQLIATGGFDPNDRDARYTFVERFEAANDQPTSTQATEDSRPVITDVGDGDPYAVKIWGFDCQPLRTLRGHDKPVSALAFRPDTPLQTGGNLGGYVLLSGGEDRVVHIWNAATGERIRGIREAHSDTVQALAFTPDGQRFVSASFGNQMHVWALIQSRGLVTIAGSGDDFRSTDVSPDGRTVVTGSQGGIVRVFSLASHDAIREVPLSGLDRFALLADERAAFVAGERFGIVDLLTGRRHVSRESVSLPRDVAWLSDGEQLVHGGRTPAVIDSRTFAAVRAIQLRPPGSDEIYSPALGRITIGKGEQLLVGIDTDGQVVLSELATGQLRRLKKSNWGTLTSFALSPANDMMVTVGESGVTILDFPSLDIRGTLPSSGQAESGATEVVFARDSQRFFFGTVDGRLSSARADGVGTQTTPAVHAMPVTALDLNPTGDRLASGSEDGTVVFWDADSMRPLTTIATLSEGIGTVKFTSDGRRLLVGSGSGIRSFDVALESFLARAARIPRRALTPNECLRYAGRTDCATPLR